MKILFTIPTHFSFFSWIVRKIERSTFSHCAIVYLDEVTKKFVVLHSDRYRVRMVSLYNFIDKNKIIENLDLANNLSEEEQIEFRKFAIDSLGIGYGFLTVIGILIARMFKCRNIFADKNSTLVCSEFIIKGTKLNHLDPEIDGPKAIYEELLKCQKN